MFQRFSIAATFLFLALFTLRCAAVDTPFVVAPSFPVGSFPTASVSADFNHDGKLDLAVANWNSGDISILLGKGNNDFRAARAFGAPGAQALATGDFNGDGNMDLVAAGGSFGDSKASILLGKGDGTFESPITYSFTADANSLVVADFDGDGKVDFAVAGGYLNIFWGKGDGTFEDPEFISTGGDHPVAVTLGDFNNDGKLDLATVDATQNSSWVSVLLNKGNRLFNLKPFKMRRSIVPSAIVAGDLNGDGKTDLVVSTGNTRIFLGNGDGSFSAIHPLEVSTVYLLLGDFNHDSRLDLAALDGTSGEPTRVSVRFGRGDGKFAQARYYLADFSPSSLALGEFNGDGFPDLTVTDYRADKVTLLSGRQGGSFRAAKAYAISSDISLFSLVTADFNSDGKLDLAIPGPGSKISVLLGDGTGKFSKSIQSRADDYPLWLALGDFNNDSKLDLAVGESNTTAVLLGNGDGTFQPPLPFVAGGSSGPIAVGDFNGDGDEDVAVANSDGNTITVALGDGLGGFDPQGSIQTGLNPSAITTADFDHDGNLDLAVSHWTDASLAILLGKGDGTFRKVHTFTLHGVPVSLAVLDLNSDGHPDVVVGFTDASGIYTLLGQGDGNFKSTGLFANGDGGDSIVAGDFDGDLVPDLVITNTGVYYSTMSFLRGKGDGTYFKPKTIDVDRSPGPLVIGDFNSDGKADVATSTVLGDVVVFRHR